MPLAIQLAVYRMLEGSTVATYESTQTRFFSHGRTETTRSLSQDSARFCKLMTLQRQDHQVQADEITQERQDTLRTAMQRQQEYRQMASRGHGVADTVLGYK
mmetsp:Transcript_11556/g.17653  ORF Transcript_11556/g.17653 Transcript_11556/m.17653 type:complete len:102 (-) Transcript_11556:466-771(-)